MYPDHHNYFTNPAQGSVINAGQFGSSLAPHPCKGCAEKFHAYDAQQPARPLHKRSRLLAAVLRAIR
jgi:hypothetical protein